MAVMEGSLSKWTNVMKGWQYRWFVLDENSGLLSYYTSKEKMMRGVRRGCVRLKGAVIGIDDEDDSTFTITVDHKTFHFQARDAEEREKWVRALEDTIFRHGSRMRWDTSRPPPTMKDFDHKVSEADAYLQLMIEQTKNLEDKIDNIDDQQEKAKCQLILEHANAMLNDIKHSIVLLQIAKNTAHPINGIYQQHLSISTHSSTEVAAGLGDSVVQQGVELGSECTEGARRRSTLSSPPSLAVPVMSYSSSEEEEDFFDADDSPFSPLNQLHSPTLSDCSDYYSIPGPSRVGRMITVGDDSSSEGQRTFSIEEQLVAVKASTGIQTSVPKTDQANSQSPDTNVITDNGCVDYDALYEDEMETDVHIESQGSVIRHLLSQVKIGMDLTKVVLPTFILERRSLLEMYADYFAHPDLFVGIADLKDPRDRMVQVVKWYLSSYHAGRKSAVAKKPYNPILGEVFYCLWDIPENEQASEDATPDGPIPWCKNNQLSFVAEQVSHHPPISAFYAEHYNKRITFNAHIYTKSKFLGLSICVYNIGCGTVSVLDYDEEYEVTFPNGYGRSILTVPWIELGGTVNIACKKTGYHADVEFITKPFYGNKKHRLMAEVYGPDEKKPFLSINGEWNGVMEAKWSDGDTEEFINVNKLSIVKKKVRPISQQQENESRRLWKEVTKGLKINDIDHATNAKGALEQKQRDEAKHRKDNNILWGTKLFNKSQDAEVWTYVNPLKQRICPPSET